MVLTLTDPETGPATEPERVRRHVNWFRWLGLVTALGLAVLIVAPVVTVGVRTVFGAATAEGGLVEVLAGQPILDLLWDTLSIAGAGTVLALALGSLLAWLSERTDARIGVLGDNLPLVPFLLPPIAGAIGWMILLSPGSGILNVAIRDLLGLVGIHLTEGPFNITSWFGIVIVYTCYMVPYVFLMMSAALRRFDASLEEQSRVCGVGRLQTVWRVTLPALKPSIMGSLLLLIWFSLALFSVPVILGPRADVEVLSMRIVQLLTFSYPPNMNAAVVLSLIELSLVGVAWLLMRRSARLGRHATIGGKSARRTLVRLGGWKWPARLLMFGYVAAAAVLPMIALLHVALSGHWSPRIDPGTWTLRWFSEYLFDSRITMQALTNSLLLAVVTSTVGIAIASLVSVYVRAGRSGRFGALLDGAIKLPASIPNIIVAVGFVLLLAGPPFWLHGTLTLLFVAYLALYMPNASTASDAAANSVGSELAEASQVAGVGGGRTFLRISVPLMLPGLLSGFALLFARIVGDLNASAILSGSSNIVVGLRILDLYTGSGSFAALATLATGLTVISSAVLLTLLGASRWLARRTGGEVV